MRDQKRLFLVAAMTVAVACGSSYPAPTQPLADVQASQRGARELGANDVPQAQLHLKLAEEQASNARRLMNDGENERAATVLQRAKADADLALALTHEHRAKEEQRATAQKNDVTTTTGGSRQ